MGVAMAWPTDELVHLPHATRQHPRQGSVAEPGIDLHPSSGVQPSLAIPAATQSNSPQPATSHGEITSSRPAQVPHRTRTIIRFMDWTVDPSADTPPWRQLVEKVLDALNCGQIGSGDALLSVRKMAAAALVNANTVARAYRELERLGVVAGQNGRGVFVLSDGPAIARANRQEATWQGLRSAWQAALAAGHPTGDLLHALQTWAQADSSPSLNPEKKSA